MAPSTKPTASKEPEAEAPAVAATEKKTEQANDGLAVYRAIAAITDAMGEQGIPKEREVSEGGPKFKFRGIEQVYAALNPLLARHNLCILPRIMNRTITERKTSNGRPLFFVTVDAEFDFVSAEDGSKHTIRTIGEAMDTGDKATNKAMSIAYKYAAFMTFSIPVEGENDDPDQTVHDVAPKETAAKRQETSPISEDESKKAYQNALTYIEECSTEAELDKVWNQKIRWDHIPEGWRPNLIKARKDHSKAISRPRPEDKPAPPARGSVAPNFDPPAADDDIPF